MRPYEAFFIPQHQRSLGRHQEIINTIIDATHESIQVHINLMRSQVVKSDGTITIVHDLYERRMAAKTLISKAVEILALHQDDRDQAGGDVKMTENLVRKSGNGSQEKNNGTWRYLSVPFSIVS